MAAELPTPEEPQEAPDRLPWLFNLCGVLTVFIWLQLVYDFIKQNESNAQGGFTVEIYLLVLGIYGGIKTIRHVTGGVPPDATDQRLIKGWYYIVLWAATGFAIAMIQQHRWRGMSVLPHDLRPLLWGVAAIFAGTGSVKMWRVQSLKRLATGASKGKSSNAPVGSEPPHPQTENDSGDGDATPDNDAAQKVLDALDPVGMTGLTRTELEKATLLARNPLTKVLHQLLESQQIARIQRWPGDPNTRYVLWAYYLISKQPGEVE